MRGISAIKGSRGSEWAKWDLHVHSPESDDYSGDWTQFITQLKNAECEVIGINDYNSVAGYKKIKEEIKVGTLDLKDKVIFPVVEFRMTDSVQNKATQTNGVTHFNFHIIFNNDESILPVDEIENFIKSLDSEGSTISTDYANKVKLKGKKVSFKATIAKLQSNIKFKDNYIIWLPYDEYGGIDEVDPNSDGWIKNDFINMSDIIGTSNQKQKDFFLWICKKPDGADKFTQEEFKKWFKNKKPCIKGSDSHNANYPIGRLMNNKSEPIDKFCWIKADLTFQGLKQTIYEPEARVFIGVEPPLIDRVRTNKTKYIDYLKINQKTGYTEKSGIWFKDVNIPLNKELVAIIGNKGSGKSALSDIIGVIGNTHNAGDGHVNLSFLKNVDPKKFRRKGYAENFEAELMWEDGTPIKKSVDHNIDKTQTEQVKYLPQSYFESLTNDIEEKGFKHTLDSVVFSHIPKADTLGKATFEELENEKKRSTISDLSNLKEDVKEDSEKIINLESKKHPDYKKEIESLIVEKQREADEHVKIKPTEVKEPVKETTSTVESSKPEDNELQNLNKQLAEVEGNITKNETELISLTQEKEELLLILSDLTRLNDQIKNYKKNNKDKFDKYGLSAESILKTNFDNSTINLQITERITKIDSLKAQLRSESQIKIDIPVENKEERVGALDLSLLVKKAKISKEIEKIKGELSKPEKDFQEYKENLNKWEAKKKEIEGDTKTIGTLLFYKNELNFINTELNKELVQARESRLEKAILIFRKKKEIIDLYISFKKAIDDEINRDQDFVKKFKMKIDVNFKLNPDFSSTFLSYINKSKKGTFLMGQEKEIKSIFLDKNLLDEKDIKTILNTAILHLEEDQRKDINPKDGKEREIKDQIEKLEEFYDFLFSLEYLEPVYELQLDGKTLDQLSPGEKGALLLVFYLMIDKDDIPLIIDQPEDNLDNKSVFEVLTHFIKYAKSRRQIIIVTHNPNLAVGADAEQIIYVELDKTNHYKFTYETGSIENPILNKRIVEILEGTMPAFDKRKLKYLKDN